MNKNEHQSQYPCPCCGYIVFAEPPGSYAICPICDWEDDDLQLRWPVVGGSANKMNLIVAQENFIKIGAKGEAHTNHTQGSPDDYKRDLNWRPIDKSKDIAEISKEEFMEIYKQDPYQLYYWNR
jgi:hypothetical protein